ncbi:RYamide receptor-like [Ylistrum balloti]|uniref:RYamide receptor-like n=1 Tax=Ylistrum balloti TaxID=509963 RepID=UPI0029059E36|nr:RYamide receptor-like [Ylistrum balloti]
MVVGNYFVNSSFSNRTPAEATTSGHPFLPTEDDVCVAELGPTEWILIVLYGIVIIVDVTGNGIVCYLIFSERQLRTITNFFLVNLAVADIAKAFTGIPFSLMVNLIFRYWPFSAFLCPFVAYIEIVVVFASAFTMVAMSVDRYIAIVHPLRPKLTYSGMAFTLLTVWLLAFAMPIPTALSAGLYIPDTPNSTDRYTCYSQKEHCLENWSNESQRSVYSLLIMTLQYGIPLVVLAFTYTRIAVIIWIRRTPGEAVRQRDERLASSKRKMVKMMIVVVLLYALCWLPLHTLQLYSDVDPTIYDHVPNSHLLWNFILWLALVHACCNPVIYFWMNKRFRYGFLRLLVCCLKRSVPQHNAHLHSQFTMNSLHQNSRTKRYSVLSHGDGGRTSGTKNEPSNTS